MSVVERDVVDGFVGPVLSDGTPIASLIDVDKREASLRLFSDPEVYRAEQQWLFGPASVQWRIESARRLKEELTMLWNNWND